MQQIKIKSTITIKREIERRPIRNSNLAYPLIFPCLAYEASTTLFIMHTNFDHEKLTVYQDAILFVAWVDDLLETLPKNLAVHNQLDRASTSIPLNIAEGNGKYTAQDRCRFFDIARGSALECAACLDVLVAKKLLDQAEPGKEILIRIVSMLVGLIRSTSPDRVHERKEEYGVDGEKAD